jgi:proliferating cell nuclear antigen
VSEFELTLNEIELEKLTIPESEYSATVKLPSGEFQKIISSLTTLGDAVTVGVSDNGVTFSVTGPCNGSINVAQTAAVDDDASTTITKSEDITLNFAMRYMGYFTKATNLSSSVSLSFSTEVPLCVEYQIEDASGSAPSVKSEVKSEGESKKVKASSSKKRQRGYIRYYLAPKIDDE